MDKLLYRFSIALAVIGLCVAIYMTVFKLTDNKKMCLGSGECSTVNSSIYSEVNGIPVAVLGILGYLAILGILGFEKRIPLLEKNGTMFTFGLSLTGFLFTLWLIYAELVLIKAICPFCLTSQVCMTLIFILSVMRLFNQPQS